MKVAFQDDNRLLTNEDRENIQQHEDNSSSVSTEENLKVDNKINFGDISTKDTTLSTPKL